MNAPTCVWSPQDRELLQGQIQRWPRSTQWSYRAESPSVSPMTPTEREVHFSDARERERAEEPASSSRTCCCTPAPVDSCHLHRGVNPNERLMCEDKIFHPCVSDIGPPGMNRHTRLSSSSSQSRGRDVGDLVESLRMNLRQAKAAITARDEETRRLRAAVTHLEGALSLREREFRDTVR